MAAIALAQPQDWFAKTSRSIRQHQGRQENGQEQIHQPACNYFAPESARKRAHLRDFAHRPLLFGDRQGKRLFDIPLSKD
ncbi:hypothetical protein [Bradyrhizobium sp. AZCC 1678]|uniref:hypothetical protein n=1 Tax=Bradyrhizobium sp. AZCC 1678 TaxID=3117030 RepID=UPI002FF36D85